MPNQAVPVRHGTMRARNLALVLGEISRRQPVSRARLAEATGFTKTTVSSLVAGLKRAGLVREDGPVRYGERGRPATAVSVNADRVAGLGLEINVDYLAACVVDLTGAVRHRFVAHATIESSPFVKNFGSAGVWLLGGWELSGILTAQSGQPYSAFVNTDLNNDANRSNERVPGSARNTYRLPSIFTVDPRITRNIRFGGERFNLKLIAEAFNVFNRQNITAVRTTLYNVSTVPATGTNPCPGLAAGQRCLVPQTTGSTAFQLPSNDLGPRILQLAVKFVF